MLSRRGFVNGTIGAGIALATPGRAGAQTPAPARKRMIVDAQVHLWTAETPAWRWVPGRPPQLPEPFTIEKLVPLMDEAGVDRVVGVRVTFLGPLAAWASDGTADWFWPAAEKAGLPVMFLAPGNSAAFARIAERHPALTLIIDHMNLTADIKKNNQTDSAIDQTVALARYPNVSCKMSASPGYSSETYPFGDMTPVLKRVFDAFGPQRCYWGTDMTNSFAKATYRQRVTHFTEMLDFLSEDDKDWVMGRAILARLDWA
jgi:predicted TIM-barrel fold metal-dependent hydrolase